MDLGVVAALIAGGIGLIVGTLGLIGVLVTAHKNRATGSEANQTDRLEVTLQALETRIEIQDRVIAGQDTRIDDLVRRLDAAEAQNNKQALELRRIKKVIGDWFKVLQNRWSEFTDEPLPTPSEEDMTLLEITAQPIRRIRTDTKPLTTA